ncbi:hypothetical protein GCM10027053_47870 [Intrasporangium mesophilum]
MPVETVVQAVDEAGRRWSWTVRATYCVPDLMVTVELNLSPTSPTAGVVGQPRTLVAAPVMPVTCRCAVTPAAPVMVAGTYMRKYHTPVDGMAYEAVYAPAEVVVAVAIVDQVVELDGRRWIWTVRAT